MTVGRILLALVWCAGFGWTDDAITIEVSVDEQALVNYHRQESLWRRQVYRETSMRIVERKAKYEKDLARAKNNKVRFAEEMAEIEAAQPVNLEDLERVLNGAKAAERAIDICIEALLVVDTAQRQFQRHRELIDRSRERLRRALGAGKGQCGLHKVTLDEVRVPVVKPGPEATAEELLYRIRNHPVPAEAFETDEAGSPSAPKSIVIPVCPKCTAALQARSQAKNNKTVP